MTPLPEIAIIFPFCLLSLFVAPWSFSFHLFASLAPLIFYPLRKEKVAKQAERQAERQVAKSAELSTPLISAFHLSPPTYSSVHSFVSSPAREGSQASGEAGSRRGEEGGEGSGCV